MPLMRGFSIVDEAGNIGIPINMQRQTRLVPGAPACLQITKIVGTRRAPRLFIHHPLSEPFLSPLEAVMIGGSTELDQSGKIVMTPELQQVARLEPGYLVELKLHGSPGSNGSSLTIGADPGSARSRQRSGS